MLSLDFYLSLFPASSREKPRFLALASTVLSQAADLLSLIQTDFLSAFDLDSAAGSQLDTLGALLNVPRPKPSTPDTDYRMLLRARSAVNHWDGTNENLPSVLEAAFPGRSASLTDNRGRHADFHNVIIIMMTRGSGSKIPSKHSVPIRIHRRPWMTS